MKTVYICDYTGKEFDNEFDCEVSEYENGGQRQAFFQLVHNFIDELQVKYPNIVVNKESLKMEDEKEFYIRDRIIRFRFVKFEFTLDGESYVYYRTSDEVGDCRWEWNIKDSVDDFILDFEKEYIYPKMTVLEGDTFNEWDYDIENIVFKFGELEENYFLNLIGNKKIRIEILEYYDDSKN